MVGLSYPYENYRLWFTDVTVAKDGQEAFELVKESMAERKLFNLIFMDVQVLISFPSHHFFTSKCKSNK